MTLSNKQNRIWPWIMLIGGGWFILNFLYNTIIFITSSFVEASFPVMGTLHILLYTVHICLAIICGWGMKKAYGVLKQQRLEASAVSVLVESDSNPDKKPIWPWFVIGIGALTLVGMGPGVLMLPIMPLFLAGMSTDSGMTPSYVPALILLIGYGLMIGYTILLVKAINVLRKK